MNQRLRKRGTESEEAITRRLETARRELELAGQYKYTVVNDDLNQAVSRFPEILTSAGGLSSCTTN